MGHLFYKNCCKYFKAILSTKGFTLVELLIVIAILGVLAAVVLVAINPIEQIKRGADAGRESAVSQLGRALLNWQTSQQQTDFSAVNAVAGTAPNYWQQPLITANEIKNLVAITPVTSNCTTNVFGGICFTVSGNYALVWTILASKSESIRAGAGTACANFAAAVWDSLQGKAGVTCLATANGVSTGLTLH